jgi:hypothetical protein
LWTRGHPPSNICYMVLIVNKLIQSCLDCELPWYAPSEMTDLMAQCLPKQCTKAKKNTPEGDNVRPILEVLLCNHRKIWQRSWHWMDTLYSILHRNSMSRHWEYQTTIFVQVSWKLKKSMRNEVTLERGIDPKWLCTLSSTPKTKQPQWRTTSDSSIMNNKQTYVIPTSTSPSQDWS